MTTEVSVKLPVTGKLDFLCHVFTCPFPVSEETYLAGTNLQVYSLVLKELCWLWEPSPTSQKSKTGKKLTNRLLQVVPGLQELLAFPLDLFLLEVHSPVVQLVLQVLGAPGIQEPLEVPGLLSFHSGPVTTGTCLVVTQFSISLPQISISPNEGQARLSWNPWSCRCARKNCLPYLHSGESDSLC